MTGKKVKKLFALVLSAALVLTAAGFTSLGTEDAAADTSTAIDCTADGSDSEDDTSAIQAALNAADEAGGGTISLAAGTYYISKTLVIYSNTTLILDDDATIVRTDGENVMIKSEADETTGGYGQAENITIQGGTWDGNVTDSTVLSVLMYFCHATNITLQDFSIKSACSKHMIIMAGIDTALVSNVTFSDFVLYTGDDPEGYYTVDGLSSEDTTEEEAFRTMEALHLDCISEDGSEASASPCDGTVNKDITVTGCTFDGLMSGVGNHYYANDELIGSGLTVTNNTFKNMSYTCVNVYNQDDATISGNTGTAVGELVRAVNSNGTITGNTVSCNAAEDGTELELCGIRADDADSVTITNNTISGGVKGIAVLNSAYSEVSGNTVSGSDDLGISLYYVAGDVTNNTVSNAGTSGIYVYGAEGSSADQTTISGNTVSGSGEKGIGVDASSYVTVESNTVSGSTSYGINANEASNITISTNTVSGGKTDDIYVYDSSTVTIKGNTVSSGAGKGIAVDATSGAVIQSNAIQASTTGIIFTGSSAGTIAYNTVTAPSQIGIYIYNSTNTSSAMTEVYLNKVTSAGTRGIQLEYSTYVNVLQNIVSSSADQGIRCINSSSHIAISGNVVTGSGQHGILVDGSGSGITVDSNYSLNNTSKDISALSGTGSASDNVIGSSGTYTYSDSSFPITGSTVGTTADAETAAAALETAMANQSDPDRSSLSSGSGGSGSGSSGSGSGGSSTLKAQKITVKSAALKKTIKYKKLKKKKQTFKVKATAKGKVTFTKKSGSKKITVSKAGKVTVKKGLKKGTYKVKVQIKAAATSAYKSAKVTKTITIKVK